ncbi:MAG: hypothetical protein WCV84_04510 [Patescibacteria group bacterium]
MAYGLLFANEGERVLVGREDGADLVRLFLPAFLDGDDPHLLVEANHLADDLRGMWHMA